MLIVRFTWSYRTGWTLNADDLRCNDINECQDVCLPSSFTDACNVGLSGIEPACSGDNEYDNAKACPDNAACSKNLPPLSERQREIWLRVIPETQRKWWILRLWRRPRWDRQQWQERERHLHRGAYHNCVKKCVGYVCSDCFKPINGNQYAACASEYVSKNIVMPNISTKYTCVKLKQHAAAAMLDVHANVTKHSQPK